MSIVKMVIVNTGTGEKRVLEPSELSIVPHGWTAVRLYGDFWLEENQVIRSIHFFPESGHINIYISENRAVAKGG